MNPTPTPAASEMISEIINQVIRGMPGQFVHMFMANPLGWLAVAAAFGLVFGLSVLNRRMERKQPRARGRRR